MTDARAAEYDQFGRKNYSNFFPVTANAPLSFARQEEERNIK